MRARLLCKFGELKGSEYEIDSEATIGRSESNKIVLGSKSISSRHAKIAFDSEAGHYVLEDLGSRNGTRLDGKTISGPQALGRLHVVNFGRSSDFVFVTYTPSDPEPAEPPSEVPPEPATFSTIVDVEPLELPESPKPTGD